MKNSTLVFLSVLVLFCLLTLIGIFEKEIVEFFMPSKGWIQFNVPDNAQRISASVKRIEAGISVCNQDTRNWPEVTVKLTGAYGAPYLTRSGFIKSGSCVDMYFSQFAEPSRKRMTMPPNENPVKVELLVGNETNGYLSIDLK